MNYTTAVFLINNAVRAVVCTYEAEDKSPRTMFKTFDKTIRVGDLVIVPTNTRHRMTVCKVVETDVDVDFDNSACVHWIVSKVDITQYQTVERLRRDAHHVGLEASEHVEMAYENVLEDAKRAVKGVRVALPAKLPEPRSE